MPYFDPTRNAWRGEVKKKKKRYVSPLLKTKTDAKDWEKDKRDELKELEKQNLEEQQKQKITPTGMDFLTACNAYLDFSELKYSKKTFAEKKRLCDDIIAKWKNISFEEINPSLVISHLRSRAEATSKNAWNKDRKNLLAMFNWIRKTYGIMNNAVANTDRMSEERKPEYLPPAEDVDKVMLAASGQDRVMLTCYYYTFARRSELFDWTWDDINFEKEWYRLWTKKRLHGDRQADYFQMPKEGELYKALDWQWENRDKSSPYVFCNPQTSQKYTTRRQFLKGLCKRAGVKPFGFKALRKFGPSVLNDVHKVSMKKLQKLLRHKSQATTEIYLKNIDDDLAAAVSLLEKKPTQKPTQNQKEASPTG